MSKERELLQASLGFLYPRRWVEPEEQQVLDIITRDIEELLAQPEQEPDLWVVTNTWGVNEYLWSEPREQVYENYKVTRFYRLPPPTREPLSDEDIRVIINQLPTGVDLDTGIELCRIIDKHWSGQ